jgi:CO dehydrogenase/acetyl-CoA synthase alpha subunit
VSSSFSKEVVDSVVTELEKYAQSSQIEDLENLAKIAAFQQRKTEAAKEDAKPLKDKLAESLARAVGLGN